MNDTLKGFEYISRKHKGKPAILYFHFVDRDDIKIVLQDFVNKADGSFTSKELDALFDEHYNRIPESPEMKTQDYKKKLKLYLRDKLEAKNKIKNGKKDYDAFIKTIHDFAEKMKSEV